MLSSASQNTSPGGLTQLFSPARSESLVLSVLGCHSFPFIKTTRQGCAKRYSGDSGVPDRVLLVPHWVAASQFPPGARINHPGQYREALFSLLVQQHKADWPSDSLSFSFPVKLKIKEIAREKILRLVIGCDSERTTFTSSLMPRPMHSGNRPLHHIIKPAASE